MSCTYTHTCVFSAAKVLSGRIAYSVPAPAATASGPKPPVDGNDSDWNVCDEDFESEEEQEGKMEIVLSDHDMWLIIN